MKYIEKQSHSVRGSAFLWLLCTAPTALKEEQGSKETKVTREIRENEEHKNSNHVKETRPQFLYGVLTALRTVRTGKSKQQLISHIWVFSDRLAARYKEHCSYLTQVSIDPTQQGHTIWDQQQGCNGQH